MDPRDFLRLTYELASSGSAAHQRSAISRAYYAAYNVAFTLIVDAGFPLPAGHRGHEAVRDYLSNSAAPSVMRAAHQLGKLQIVRVRADYMMRDPLPEQASTVARWLPEAERIVRDLDVAAGDPATREGMLRAMQAWERRAIGGEPPT